MINLLTKSTELTAMLWNRYIIKGDLVVDGTVGNGYDTLKLAELVGSDGTVYGFDTQKDALASAFARLEEANLEGQCNMIQDSHHKMRAHIHPESWGKIGAVIFNLGYLPGGEKSHTTKRETTLLAIEESLDLIKIDGLVSITLYGGHEEGASEKQAVLEFAEKLDSRKYHVGYVSFVNQKNNPPEILWITKKK